MGGLLSDIFNYIDTGRASHAMSQANIAAEHGVLGATAAGQSQLDVAGATGNKTLADALAAARGDVLKGTTAANQALAGTLGTEQKNLQPYLKGGAQGETALTKYALSNPQFHFNLQDYLNSPAMKFQMEQGTNAIQNSAAAGGRGLSGATLKDLTQYGQGLASTYYNQAFNQAQSQFQTNQNTTLQNLSALTGTGEVANAQSNTALQNYGNQVSANDTNAGRILSGQALGVAGEQSSQGLTIADLASRLGLEGSTLAGNFAVGAGNARAAGIMGQGQALSNGIGDLAGLAVGGFTGGAGIGGGAGAALGDIFGPH